MPRSTIFTLLTSLSLVAAGCGDGKPKGRLPTYPVSGVVTYKGKAVEGADITFFNETANKSSFGRTDSDGKYKLMTYAPNDGALEGKQIVTISKIEVPAQVPTIAPIESENYAPPGVGKSTDPPKPKALLPEKYANQGSSGLMAVVNKEGENKFDFALE